KIWADWEKFASYAFNKSHATCYSWVAYQTAYLKAHYPAEYMAAVMSRNLANITEITKLMDECKAMGIPTKGPDVNGSRQKFSANKKGEVRFGISAIKGVGGAAADAIVSERDKNGPYKDIFDFIRRINFSNVTSKNIEYLVLSGAFDDFKQLRREDFFAVNAKGERFIDLFIRHGQKYQQEIQSIKNSLFGGDESEIDIATPPIIRG
ncbi:DNA polymerase III subunit alpha, partial [Parabacteroides distasonis]